MFKASKWSDKLMNYIPWGDMTAKQADKIKTVMRKHKPCFMHVWSIDEEIEELRYYGAFEGIRLGEIDRCLDAAENVDFNDMKVMEKLYQRFRKARISEGGYCTGTEIRIRKAVQGFKERHKKRELQELKAELRGMLRKGRFKEMRVRIGLSQAAMARKLGIDRSLLYRIERHKLFPSDESLDRLGIFINALKYNDLQKSCATGIQGKV